MNDSSDLSEGVAGPRGVTDEAGAAEEIRPGDVSGFRHGSVPRDVREGQLLVLAEQLFAERGFSAASMDELARRAGVSKPVIYDLLGSKDHLFRACMDRVAGQMASAVVDAVAGHVDGRDRLAAGAQAWFVYIAEHRPLWTALLAGGDTPLGAEANEIRRSQARVIAALLTEDAVSSGAEPSDLIIDAVAHLVVGAFESIGRWSGDHPELTPKQLGELCTAVLIPGLAALAGPRSSP